MWFLCSVVLVQENKLQQQVLRKKKLQQPIFFWQKRGSHIIYFWGILLQNGFLILIRFRGQFSGEIFINLSCFEARFAYYFYSLYLDDFIVFGILKCIF